MPQVPGSGLSGWKLCALLLSFALASFILGRPLYWHFIQGVVALQADSSGRDCPPCVCECPSETSSILASGLSNNSTDCAKPDLILQGELDKHSADLLSEELKLQEIVAEENQQRSDFALLEVRKMSSQYQKEAEKCNFGMETCEEAREKAEEALIGQREITEMWEQRARGLGWSD